MPGMTCPKCSYRMLQPIPTTCPNCRSLLSALSSSTGSTPFAPTVPAPPITTTPSTLGPFTSAASRSTSPSSSYSAMTPISSSPTSSTLTSYTGGGSGLSSPLLEGLVVDPPSTLEIPAAIDWSHIVLGLIFIPFSLIFLVAFMTSRDRPDRRTTVTRLRVLQRDGSMREARIEGDLLGTSVSQGDEVELHGKDRGGALIVQSGFNRTVSGGQILVHKRNSPIGTRIAALVLLAIWSLCIFSTLLPLLYTLLSSAH